LFRLTHWTLAHGQTRMKSLNRFPQQGLKRATLIRASVILCVLRFAKFIYLASITHYFTFHLMQRFRLSLQHSQVFLLLFLASAPLGTFVGGPVGDRVGRKAVIWLSSLGVAPFALALPYVNLVWTGVLACIIGLVMSSAFAALVVYAQEAAPGRVGLVSGLMFGLMFGIGGIGAAGLGVLADRYGVVWAYGLTSFLPLLGLATAFRSEEHTAEL